MSKVLDSIVQFVKKNDSELLLGASLVLGGVTIIETIKSTRKVEPIVEEHKDKMQMIHMQADTGVKIDPDTHESLKYTDKEKRKDTFKTYAATTGKMIKLYSVPLATGTVSLGCNLASHNLLSNRNIELQAALTGVTQVFNNYRDFIKEKDGEEVDREAMYGIRQAKKKLKEENETYTVYDKTDNFKLTTHSRLFDEASGSHYWSPSRQSNASFLFSIEQSIKRKLKYRRSHTISYNEMVDMLDLDPAADGNVMGLKFVPGKDPLDENGLPDIEVFVYWMMNNGKYSKKDIEGEIDMPTGNEAAMLIDWPSLVYIA